MSFRITVQGIENSTRFFRGVSPMIDGEVRKAYQEHGDYVLRQELAGRDKYPPERPGQRYVRTGRLGDSWTKRQYGRYHVTFSNKTPYAQYVVGDSEGRKQAWMHAGRWWLALERIQRANDRLIERIAAGIEAAWRRMA